MAAYAIIGSLVFPPLPFSTVERLVHCEIDWSDLLSRPDTRARLLHIAEAIANPAVVDLSVRVAPASRFERTPSAEAWRLRPVAVSAAFSDLLTVRPEVGRWFTDDEADLRPQPVVLSHALWVAHFGADPAIIGRDIALPGTMDARPWRVVGIMPRGFDFPRQTNAWVPVAEQRLGLIDVPTIVRLSPGVTVAQLRQALPSVTVTPLTDYLRPAGTWGAILLGVSTCLLLLIAWSHCAALLMSRAMTRRTEIATHLALGATPRAIHAGFLIETLCLATVAFALSAALLPIMGAAMASQMPLSIGSGWAQRYGDALVVGAVLCGVGATFGYLAQAAVLGTADVAFLSRARAFDTRRRARWVLMAQVCTVTVMVYVSALAVRTSSYLAHADRGFVSTNLLHVTLPAAVVNGVHGRENLLRVINPHKDRYRRTLAAVAALRGVVSTATASFWPFQASPLGPVVVARDRDPSGASVTAQEAYITRGFLSTIGARLIDGREPTSDELRRVSIDDGRALVTRSLATTLARSGSAVGTVIRDRNLRYTITGVIDDMYINGLDRSSQRLLLPYYPDDEFGRIMLIRLASGRPPTTMAEVQSILKAIWGPRAPAAIQPIDEDLHAAMVSYDARRLLMTWTSATALALVVFGAAALVVEDLARRRRDLAIRLALGARRRDVWLYGVRMTVLPVVTGLAAGIGAGAGVAALWRAVFPGGAVVDVAMLAFTLGVVVMTVSGACGLASYQSARRVEIAETLQRLGV
jgi:hypothetical protein